MPAPVAAEVEFRSDRKCCVCSREGTQLHHLDGKPSNNKANNLALLCLRHHDEASRQGGLTRKLSKKAIVKFREHHYRSVQRSRAYAGRMQSGAGTESSAFEIALDALYVFEIRKLASKRDSQWSTSRTVLSEIERLGYLWSRRIRLEALEVLNTLSIEAWNSMPRDIAERTASLALSLLPFWIKKGTRTTQEKQMERDVLQVAFDTGFGLARAGFERLNDLKIVEAGAALMSECIELSAICDNSLRPRLEEAMKELAGLAANAGTTSAPGAAVWIRFRQREALDKTAWDSPDYPREVANLVFR
jgi:hypothetical protein